MCLMWPFLWLEDEPPADLNAPWLEDVGIACRDTEVHIVNINVWQAESSTIEQVEEFKT